MMVHDDDDDDEDMNLLMERRRRSTSSGYVMLPMGRLVALCLGAMLIGAAIPMLCYGTRNNSSSNIPFASSVTPTALSEGGSAKNTDTEKSNLRQSSSDDKYDNNTIPKIAWLMSFPNSGTSFTITLVQTASNMSMASNYGWEHLGAGNVSYPVQKGGPYWLDPDGVKPHHLVLTKTHCGGYCHDCRPRKSVESPHSFLMHCSRADGTILDTKKMKDNMNNTNSTTNNNNSTNSTNSSTAEIVPITKNIRHVYDYQHDVDRAVHLIRDPLDNMVSRYHLGLHKVEKGGDADKLQRYTYDAQGYTNFCSDIQYEYAEHTDSHVDQDVLRLIQDVPCHMDLFRYVQWHNLAFITTHDLLNVPVHMVHYQEYTDHFDDTLSSLLEFLDLPNTGVVTEFETGKSYRDYFTTAQIDAMRNATRILASPMTWSHLERYF
mmetsp:Transcript_14389/g.23756  ORF Transcript_14389/g.23756 Transcript_14389/m.23756 type:complete len:433 (-) Transcript_14389:158-1456(-)|eukprot:CAMPEP_0119005318 /NCGR_PEP_ID=MMETSP1176-20130426/1646_1 /TAXON_ID=265551 /ORGANISM="Synedropsis recta cf, Strain CCMP1620" /LENGTH=432 /DNA_ID=CAMNT_0006957107 /DNA_START=121 /DNA_END=1419 /DNA_ORIENTATION=+